MGNHARQEVGGRGGEGGIEGRGAALAAAANAAYPVVGGRMCRGGGRAFRSMRKRCRSFRMAYGVTEDDVRRSRLLVDEAREVVRGGGRVRRGLFVRASTRWHP